MTVSGETQRKIFSLFVLCGSQLASWYPPMLRVDLAHKGLEPTYQFP